MQQPNIVTWFTQPANSFASFYYYNTVTGNMVRIRLELNRADNGRTGAFYTANRFVGFYQYQPPGTPGRLSTANPLLFTANAATRQITFNNVMVLQQNPQAGLNVCDFSGPIPPNFVHKGNPVTLNPQLPPNVTVQMLAKIAGRAMQTAQSVDLTAANATTADLSNAVVAAANV